MPGEYEHGRLSVTTCQVCGREELWLLKNGRMIYQHHVRSAPLEEAINDALARLEQMDIE